MIPTRPGSIFAMNGLPAVTGPLADLVARGFARVDGPAGAPPVDITTLPAAGVKYVVVSHLHLDHSGGMFMFPKAKFLIMANELRYAYWPDPDRRWAFIFDDFVPTRAFDWLELDGDFDLFDDGSLHLLKTPGHTPGESSLYVRLPNRKIVLCGDTTHLRAALEAEATMPLDTDPVQATLSIKRLKAIRDMHEATIWISHDPDDWAELPHAPTAIE